MPRSLAAVAVCALVVLALVVFALVTAGGPIGPAGGPARAQDGQFGGLPEGQHRSLVFAVCSGCHSVKLVMQQGMTRSKWDSTLDWMTEQQGMAELDRDTEAKILDYLATHFGADQPSGGGQDEGGGLSPYNRVQPMQPPE
jgi:hypothetical protein